MAELGFLARAENILFVGRPGGVKTHLAIALALRACQQRQRALFVPALELLAQLRAAEVSRSLPHFIEVIASAILDRLLHYSHVFLIPGPSYRMKDKFSASIDDRRESD